MTSPHRETAAEYISQAGFRIANAQRGFGQYMSVAVIQDDLKNNAESVQTYMARASGYVVDALEFLADDNIAGVLSCLEIVGGPTAGDGSVIGSSRQAQSRIDIQQRNLPARLADSENPSDAQLLGDASNQLGHTLSNCAWAIWYLYEAKAEELA